MTLATTEQEVADLKVKFLDNSLSLLLDPPIYIEMKAIFFNIYRFPP